MGRSQLGVVAGRGALAGLVGTAVMTAFQRTIEMPISGRRESAEPLIEQLTRFRPPQATSDLLPRGLRHRGCVGRRTRRAGLTPRRRGLSSGATVFTILWPGDAVGNAALGVHAWPWRWSARDAAVDVVDKLVLALATALSFDRLRSDG